MIEYIDEDKESRDREKVELRFIGIKLGNTKGVGIGLINKERKSIEGYIIPFSKKMHDYINNIKEGTTLIINAEIEGELKK